MFIKYKSLKVCKVARVILLGYANKYRKTAIKNHGFYCKKKIFRMMACIQGRTSNDVGLLLQETNFYFKITDTFQVINDKFSIIKNDNFVSFIFFLIRNSVKNGIFETYRKMPRGPPSARWIISRRAQNVFVYVYVFRNFRPK